MHCTESDGRQWPLEECQVGAESPNSANAPSNSISKQDAKAYLDMDRSHLNNEHRFAVDQIDRCFSVEQCKSHIEWSTSQWSGCELLDNDMHRECRSVGSDIVLKAQLYGIRTRKVGCYLSTNNLHESLRPYVINELSQGGNSQWIKFEMNSEFCRMSKSVGAAIEEPTNKEGCNRPSCYRWGEVKTTRVSDACS